MIRLQLLGGLDMAAPGLMADARVRRHRPLALLALLAVAAPRPVSREKIMSLIWPESDAKRASNSLRQMLFWLRRDLNAELFIMDTGGGVRLDASKLEVDLWTFRAALGRNALADAAEAYGGAFLEGFHLTGSAELSHWVEGEREQLGRQYLAAIGKLADRAAENRLYDEAVLWRRRQIVADPYSSRSALALMRALAEAGDKPGALEYARNYEAVLRAHLEVEPDPIFTAYVVELRRSLPATAEHSVENEAPEPMTPVATPGAERNISHFELPPTRGRSRRWLAGAFVLVGTIAGSLLYGSRSHEGVMARNTTMVLATGTSQIAGRDTAVRLVSCKGEACPGGTYPQPAFVVPKHNYYALPVSGTRYVAPVANAIVDPGKPKGYACCTTAVFEQTFTLPPDAVSARIMISLLADNAATASINGVDFGGHADRNETNNFAGPPGTFSKTFAPSDNGTNRLRVTLWDGGGALGLHYHGIVTYETANEVR